MGGDTHHSAVSKAADSHAKSHGHGHHAADAHHGHGHHGHGHHGPHVSNSVIHYDITDPAHPVSDFKSPDWRIYKVENAPQLVQVQKRLAALGLKDPWLRNEVWRFDPQFGSSHPRRLLLRTATTGMKLGLALAVGTILLETAYGKLFGKGDSHGHGHGHGHAHDKSAHH